MNSRATTATTDETSAIHSDVSMPRKVDRESDSRRASEWLIAFVRSATAQHVPVLLQVL